MSSNSFFTMVDDILGAIEAGAHLTVFDDPGPSGLAKLPDPLGGDKSQQPSLQAAAAASKKAFFKLLDEKALFLMLPRLIIAALKNSVRVKLSEEPPSDPKAAADTIKLDNPRQAQIHFPGATAGLAKVAADLGRLTLDKGFPEDEPSDLYGMVGTIYHELTHAWLWLYQFYDNDFQTLWSNGVVAYLDAKGEDGSDLDPESAFSEAAAYYVDDRIVRWCTAIFRLDLLTRVPPVPPDTIASTLASIVADYNKDTQVYGVVNHVKIASPALSPELRAALNDRILDGLPLTKSFNDTPLANTLNNVYESLVPSPPPPP
jgi:hypothetical protein